MSEFQEERRWQSQDGHYGHSPFPLWGLKKCVVTNTSTAAGLDRVNKRLEVTMWGKEP